MIKIGYVFLNALRRDQAGFATHVPVRMAKLLGETAQIHVIYAGFIDEAALEAAGVQAHRCPDRVMGLRRARPLAVARTVAHVARKYGVDVFQNVWAHYRLLPVVVGARLSGAAVAARVVGVPIGGSDRRTPPRLRRWAGKALERFVLRRVDAVHLLSESLAEVYEGRGVPRTRMTVISQGCDVELFSPTGTGGLADPPVLLYVGRLARRKGVDVFLCAVREARNRGYPFRGLVVGEGPMRSALISRSRDMGLADAVEFAGELPHDRLPALMREATALVLPSRTEGLPNVVLEALACETPVIASDVGAVPELLASGGGCTVPVDSPEEIASLGCRLVDDLRMRSEMGRRGRDYVLRHHSFEAVRPQYEDFFSSIQRAS